MFKKISIRWRLTILSALLLTVCCIGLTIALNLSAFRLVDSIDATIITTPATESSMPQNGGEITVSPTPSQDSQNAKNGFRAESIIYMIIIILGGSALTYYVVGKALKPLETLNDQVKNITVHNLSETLDVPSTKDEIAELTSSFNEMTDKLDQAFMTQQRFSASAAHELRTPLAVLQTKVDVFKKKNSHSNEEYEVLIAVFEKQILRLRGLVSKLLDMTNMDDFSEKSTVALNDVFEDIVSELSFVAKEKNITLSMECNNSSFYGNTDLLYRAFYNLVENGIKYNKNGGHVAISCHSFNQSQVDIKILDTGIGIPDDMKKHIFEPFYRVDKSRSREMGGAGLGLAITNDIIKNHGGFITITDNENGGSCFDVILPNS